MRVRRYCFVFLPLFFLFLCAFVSAETYAWPLEENFGISATFGEFRNEHFHAGIDLSTNGETGLPVLAIADGQVYRLKIQKRAYGRALYIRHADGMVSVYAHLERFSEDLGLEQEYQKEIRETGTRYVGDVFLEPPVPVKRGDVVAYSGETGAGLPHLHLELRRTESVPVNPLMNGFQDSSDPTPPAFQACYLYPLDARSAVDGELETKEIRLRKEEVYFVSEATPVVRGDFMVSVSVYDAALRPYRRTPQKLVFSIDHQTLYSIEFNEFSYMQPEGFGLVYDLGKPGPSYYEYPVLLTRLPGNSLPFVLQSVPFSTKNLTPGLHQLRIEAGDSNGNTSVAHIEFIVNTPPRIRIESVAEAEGNLSVTAAIADPDWKIAAPPGLAGEVEYSIDQGKSFLPFPQTTLDMPPPKDVARFIYRIPLAELGTETVLIKARGFDGVEYSSYSVIALSPGPPPMIAEIQGTPIGEIRLLNYSNSVKVTFDTNELLTYPLELLAGTPPALYLLESKDLTSYQSVVPAPKINGLLTILLPGNQRVSTPVDHVLKGTSIQIRRENYQLLFESDSLYWDTFVWTKSLPAYQARYLPLIGPMLQIGPRGVPMKRHTVLGFQYPADVERPERLSIYAWNRAKQKWESLPSWFDQTARLIYTKINVFDLYALIYDNLPPSISPIFPRRNSVTGNQTPKLAATIRDSGMDVDDEKVTFYVDGIAHPAEYDPDRNVAVVTIAKPLRKGYHKFWIVAYDYAGNKTVSTRITFRVR